MNYSSDIAVAFYKISSTLKGQFYCILDVNIATKD